ncbi:MAG: substrate-binding domain-containing protein [bacterium]|nr:substrate-binding domain-containing protein [bacterium]MCY4272293.1 substrate-binding domain-containing protein [bacterium]
MLAFLLVLALVASACGNDDDDDGGSAGETPPATASASPESTPAAAPTEEAPAASGPSEGIAAAAARIEAFREPQGALAIDEPLAERPEGKTAAYIQCGVPVCEEIRIGIAGAAESLGMSLEVFNHDDTPENVASAWQAALDAGVDVVLASGNPREFFAEQLAQFQSRGVPAIVWSIPEGFEPGDGITANLLTADDYYFYGVLLADYALAQTGGEGDVIFFGLPAFPVLSILESGFTDEMADKCPDCSVRNVSIDLTALLAGEVPGQVVSAIQSTGDPTHLIFAFGGMLFGVPEAMADAGLDVPAASQAGGGLNFGFIAEGNVQTAEMGLASEFLGWRAMDAAARALAGQSVGRADTPQTAEIDGHPDVLASGLPLQVLEADDMGFLETDPNLLWPGVEDFKALFEELWAG